MGWKDVLHIQKKEASSTEPARPPEQPEQPEHKVPVLLPSGGPHGTPKLLGGPRVIKPQPAGRRIR